MLCLRCDAVHIHVCLVQMFCARSGRQLVFPSRNPYKLNVVKLKLHIRYSSRSSGWVRWGEKHEIYAATLGGHLFYDLFAQGQGSAMAASASPPGSATEIIMSLIVMDWANKRKRTF